MIAIGLMSGTSLDGVDAVLVQICDEEPYTYKTIKSITYPYQDDFKKRLFANLTCSTAKLSEISSLNFELGYIFKDAIDKLLEGTAYKYRDIAFVASHGQTIWHDPAGIYSSTGTPSTLQIGEASVISYLTHIKVIDNFRCVDIASGGTGAPLVPLSEYLLYGRSGLNLVLQNIGGIGNLTYLKKGGMPGDVLSFDTGPGNVMIDYFMQRYYHLPFDNKGSTGRCGKIIPDLYDFLKKDPYLNIKPPKATGREKYNEEYFQNLIARFDLDEKKPEDVIATLTAYTAYTVAYHYKKYLPAIDLVVVCGGGAHNEYLLDLMRKFSHLKIITGKEYGIDIDFKEALAFVVIGHRTLLKKPGNLKNVTGAKDNLILGRITDNPFAYAKKQY